MKKHRGRLVKELLHVETRLYRKVQELQYLKDRIEREIKRIESVGGNPEELAALRHTRNKLVETLAKVRYDPFEPEERA